MSVTCQELISTLKYIEYERIKIMSAIKVVFLLFLLVSNSLDVSMGAERETEKAVADASCKRKLSNHLKTRYAV